MKLGENEEIVVRGPEYFPRILESSGRNRQSIA